MTVFLLGLLFGAVFLIWWYWWRPHPRSPPVYPGTLPIIGHVIEAIKYRNDIWTYMESIFKYNTDGCVQLRMGTHIMYANHTLRAGSTCILVLWSLHRHSSWGPDANQFKPERWLNPATLPTNPNVYAAFSIGKRNCIGKQYSMMILKTSVAHIIRNFQLSADISSLKWKYEVVLKLTAPSLVSITKRS